MPRQCSVCAHQKLAEIDRALVGGVSLRDIAGQYRVSKSSLERHKANHLPATLIQAQAAQEAANADDLLGQIEDLRRQAQAIKDQAMKTNDLRTALQGIRELVRIVELLAKLRGELDERAQINILLLPEWVQVRTRLLYALTPYPEARQAAAAALLEVDGGTGD